MSAGQRINDLIEEISRKVESMERRLENAPEDRERKVNIFERETDSQEKGGNNKETETPLNEEAIKVINMLRLGRTYNVKSYQNEFKTMINVRDEEIAYIPDLYTQEEYDSPESDKEPEKEKQINILQDIIDEDKRIGIPNSEGRKAEESDVGERKLSEESTDGEAE